MADIMCGIVNDVDVRKADDADNEQAEPHRKDSLDNTDIFDGNRKMGGVGHEKPLLGLYFSRTWILLRPLFFHFPGDISTGEVKVHSTRNICATNLGPCRRSEGAFMGVKKDLAIPGLRAQPQQRPERPAMHHAEAMVVIRFKNQGINIVAPGCRILATVQAVCSGQMHALIVRACPRPMEGTAAGLLITRNGPWHAQEPVSLPLLRAGTAARRPQTQGFLLARRLLRSAQSVAARVPARRSVWSESCRPGASLPGARRDKNPGGLDRQDWHRQVLPILEFANSRED
jgi:hypothetical protein